jgi:hypothetical protein
MKAPGYGFNQAVKVLIEHHADVNLKDSKGRTAPMDAATGRYSTHCPCSLKMEPTLVPAMMTARRPSIWQTHPTDQCVVFCSSDETQPAPI